MKRGLVLISPHYHAVAKQQAILTNGVRCETWCGRGCTKKEHDRAARLALATSRALGPKWVPALNHNMGWYASAVSSCGRVRVSANVWWKDKSVSYTAFLGEGKWAEQGETPRKAVLKVYEVATAELNRLNAVLRGLPQV